jgi:Restriction endonuclease
VDERELNKLTEQMQHRHGRDPAAEAEQQRKARQRELNKLTEQIQQDQRAAAEAEQRKAPPLWLPPQRQRPNYAAEDAERRRQSAAARAEQERQRVAAARAEQERQRAATIETMTGEEFEEYVADRLRESGWDVSHTRKTGDYGVDLIAIKAGRRRAVQCKRLGKPVGIRAVQEVVSGAGQYDCKETMVVSNQEFTQAAKQIASIHNCELIGRSKLAMTTWGER